MKTGLIVSGIVGLLLMFPTSLLAQGSFSIVGAKPGVNVYGYFVSDDGQAVAGVTMQTPQACFRWTAATGMVNVGGFPYGISGDGSIIIGIGGVNGQYMWTASGGQQRIALPANWSQARPYAISGDGQVIVGGMGGDNNSAWRWTASGGAELIPGLTGFTRSVDASYVSDDGSIIAGNSWSDVSHRPFVWTATGGTMEVPVPLYQGYAAYVTGLSADGRTVVGYNQTGNGYRYSSPALDTILPLPGKYYSVAPQAVSGDGSVVVGECYFSAPGIAPSDAVLWTKADGTRLLKDVLAQNGVDISDWRLATAYDISPDGRYISGTAIDPQGQLAAYLVEVPEPATLSLLALGSLAMLRHRKQHGK